MTDKPKSQFQKFFDLAGIAAWLVAALVARHAFLAPTSEPPARAAVEKSITDH